MQMIAKHDCEPCSCAPARLTALSVHQGADDIAQCAEAQIDLGGLLEPIPCLQRPAKHMKGIIA